MSQSAKVTLINHLAQATNRAFAPRVQLVKCVGAVMTEATHLMIYTVSLSRFVINCCDFVTRLPISIQFSVFKIGRLIAANCMYIHMFYIM